MAIRKSLPGPGNPVFYFWAPNFESPLIHHPNVVPLAFVNVTRPNQWRPPLASFLQPSDFSEETGFDNDSDEESWNIWRKAIGDLDDPAWEECVKAHLRACVRAAADVFEHCGFVKGMGSRGNGLYESGVSLIGLGTFFNSQPGDDEWHDMARLYAHPDDAVEDSAPDTLATLKNGDDWYLPGNKAYPHMQSLSAGLYTPWCQRGIAEVAPLTLYFAQQLKAELDARGLCYPAELVLDNEQSPIGWTLANGDGSVQRGNFNNVRADDRYGESTVYEIRSGSTYVPVTYQDHFDLHNGGGEISALLVGGKFNGSYGAPPVHAMLWRLYTFAYDYAEHKAFYEPWKSVFPGSKCGNYENRHVPPDSDKKIVINTSSGLEVACEHLRSDISAPVLYPNVNRPGYSGNTDPHQAFLAASRDIVDSCDKVLREFRGWAQMPIERSEKINTIFWNPDRFARFITEMGDVGGHGFYVFNDPSWTNDAEKNALVADAFERTLVYVARAQRGLDPINIGAGKRR